MEKERLTREIIQKDLTRHSRQGIGVSFILGGPLIPLTYLAAYVASLSRTIGVIERTAINLMFVMAVLIFILMLTYYVKQYLRMKRGNFRIVTDCVVDMANPEFYGYNGDRKVTLFSGRDGLVFSRFGEFVPASSKRHQWSQKFNLNRNGELMYAHIGDEFYIVTTDEKTILEAYNKRLFALDENEQEISG